MYVFHVIQVSPWSRPQTPPTLALTMRNCLVNQVEFLGLVHTFETMSPNNVQKYAKPTQKRYGYSSRDRKIFTIVREVQCNSYRSRNLIGPYHF